MDLRSLAQWRIPPSLFAAAALAGALALIARTDPGLPSRWSPDDATRAAAIADARAGFDGKDPPARLPDAPRAWVTVWGRGGWREREGADGPDAAASIAAAARRLGRAA